MTREEMMNKVMRKYGLENQVTLVFCEIAETWKSNEAVETMFILAMDYQYDGHELEEEEEEEEEE